MTKPASGSFDKPNGVDEIHCHFKVYQTEDQVLREHSDWKTLLNHGDITPTIKRVFETLRIGEISRTEIQAGYLAEKDQETVVHYNLVPDLALFVEIELLNFTSVIDWYRDGTTLRYERKQGYS